MIQGLNENRFFVHISARRTGKSYAAAILAFDAVLICFEVLLDLVGPLSDLPTVSLGGIMLLLILLRARLL